MPVPPDGTDIASISVKVVREPVPVGVVTDCVTIWTIYHRPSDYPYSWVLRGHEVLPDRTQPHDVCFVAPTLNEVRTKVPPGTLCIGRGHDDHPVIHELWVASTHIHEIANLTGVRPTLASRERLTPEPGVDRLGQQARGYQSPGIRRQATCFVVLGGLRTGAKVDPGGKRLNLEPIIRQKLDLEAKLAMAKRQVMEGEARIRRVRAVIERTRETGLNAELAENLLNTMLVTLSLLNDKKAGIEAELKAMKPGPKFIRPRSSISHAVWTFGRGTVFEN